MEKEELEYLPAMPPMIIVKELTLDTYLENNAYWLKLYYLSGVIDSEILDNTLIRYESENE